MHAGRRMTTTTSGDHGSRGSAATLGPRVRGASRRNPDYSALAYRVLGFAVIIALAVAVGAVAAYVAPGYLLVALGVGVGVGVVVAAAIALPTWTTPMLLATMPGGAAIALISYNGLRVTSAVTFSDVFLIVASVLAVLAVLLVPGMLPRLPRWLVAGAAGLVLSCLSCWRRSSRRPPYPARCQMRPRRAALVTPFSESASSWPSQWRLWCSLSSALAGSG